MIVLLYHLCAFSTGIFPSFRSFKADKKTGQNVQYFKDFINFPS